MARGINKVILIGNLGTDPDVRGLPQGGVVANLNVATEESWKDKQTGKKQSKTEWHRVVYYGRLAEVAGEYLKKGSQIYVEGRLQTRKWQDKTGNDRYTTEVVGYDLQMLGVRTGNGARPAAGNGQKPAEQYGGSMPPPAAQVSEPVGDFDDDIPF